MNFVYMIKDPHGRLYIGISKDPFKRLEAHNRGVAAKFTRVGNFALVFSEKHESLKDARSREVQIKKWRREKKEMLIRRYERGLSTH